MTIPCADTLAGIGVQSHFQLAEMQE